MTTWTDIGNIGKFTVTPQPEIKEHYSSRAGTKEVDKIAVTAKKAEFALDVDEWTLDNALMALLGIQSTDTTGTFIEIMGASSVERQLKFVGTGDFGGRAEIIFPRVFLLCKDAINLIGDDWSPLTLTGQIMRANVVDGSFGTMRFLGGATGSAPVASPNPLNYVISKGIVSVAAVGT
jgi:hypothetical protein